MLQIRTWGTYFNNKFLESQNLALFSNEETEAREGRVWPGPTPRHSARPPPAGRAPTGHAPVGSWEAASCGSIRALSYAPVSNSLPAKNLGRGYLCGPAPTTQPARSPPPPPPPPPQPGTPQRERGEAPAGAGPAAKHAGGRSLPQSTPGGGACRKARLAGAGGSSPY